MKKNKVGIVGFGRFGKLLCNILQKEFAVYILRRKSRRRKIGKAEIYTDPNKFYQKAETIFFAVPIGKFENVIISHKKYIKEHHTLIDVLSVKVHPKKVFLKHFSGKKTKIILTHPLFGPDSVKTQGLKNLPIVMYPLGENANKSFSFWKNFFQQKGLNVFIMPPEKHDKLAANSQGITHFIGRMLEEFKLKPTPIDTIGAKKLQDIMQQTCNDTWELFRDLQIYNPYTRQMRRKLGRAYEKIFAKLLPERVKKGKILYGIQGGKGSFNEQAINFYIKQNNIKNAQIVYLYTTKAVLNALENGHIDFGLFAVHNSVGGIVWESARSLAEHKVEIVEEFAIPIRHFLMIRKEKDKKDIKTIIAHPQVLKQCRKTLSRKYPNLKKISGKDRLIDTAAAAEALSQGNLPSNYAVLGPKQLSEIYNLKIIDTDLQDDKDNLTYFFLTQIKRS